MVEQRPYDPAGGVPITKGIDCSCHLGVFCRVIQQAGGRLENASPFRADQLQDPGLDPFRTLGDLAQHQHGYAEGGRLLLDAARICKNECSTFH